MIRLEIGIGEAPVDCEVIAPRYNGDMPPRSPESVVTFGHVVRTARIRIRWTQRELSRRSGVPQSKISLIERGLVDDVRLSEIETLCSALRIEYRIDYRTPDVLARPADLVHARCSAHVDRRLSAQGFRS